MTRRAPARAGARAAALALALACIGAQASDGPRHDVSVLEGGRQVASFDLPEGDAICVLAHVTEQDPLRGAWHLAGRVELHVSLGGRRVFTFAARELILTKAAVERLQHRAAGATLPKCPAAPPPKHASDAADASDEAQAADGA
ncbi:MAG TPA: hypothetical protein VIP05_12605 [Burkholderiaceae bacterium]